MRKEIGVLIDDMYFFILIFLICFFVIKIKIIIGVYFRVLVFLNFLVVIIILCLNCKLNYNVIIDRILFDIFLVLKEVVYDWKVFCLILKVVYFILK